MGWIIGGIVVVLVVIFSTVTGRKASGRLRAALGAKADLESQKLEKVRLLKVEHEARVQLETRENLAKAESAFVSAQQILEDENELKRQLAQWESNRDKALDQARALVGDDTSDSKQSEELGKLKSIGQTAINKIAGLEADLASNAENYEWARQIIAEAEELFRELPDKAAAQLREGEVAAATAEIAQAQKGISDSMTSFGSSKAGQVLIKLKAKAVTERAKAAASKARLNAAPASADVAARMLNKMGSSKTADFDQLLNVQVATPASEAEGSTEEDES